MARDFAVKYLTTQKLDYTSTSASTAAFQAQTYAVRLVANSAINYRVFDVGQSSSTCTSADPALPASWPLEFGVNPGQKISIIKMGGGTVTSADGTAWVTELSL